MKNKFKAFTLAEIMIVLTVIGILVAIILPSAQNAMPNEDIMKFKKTHNAITLAVSEMVNSDKYFLDGDLTKKIDGSEANTCYQAQALADILNGEVLKCENKTGLGSHCVEIKDKIDDIKSADTNCNSTYSIQWFVLGMDVGILSYSTIKLQNGTIISYLPPVGSCVDSQGFNASYGAIFLLQKEIDYDVDSDGIIDAFDATLMLENCVNNTEDKVETFTYLVRSDGKIITSSKIDEWLNKSIQEK